MSKVRSGNILLDVDLVLSKMKLKDKMTVADFGCGTTGFFVFPVAKSVGKNGKVYAVDILKIALENIKKKARHENLLSVQVVWSDLEIFGATEIEAGSVDVGLLINTLYLSSRKNEILRETTRTLKKGARIIVIDWKDVAIPFGPQPEERIDKDALIEMSKKNSLSLEEEFSAGEYHFGLIFTKI
jgi:ubiquinone/menaquinone biosynthesis C-methylase UbiE